MGADALAIQMKLSMDAVQGAILEIVRYTETVESRFGLKERALQDNIQAMCKKFEAAAERMDIDLQRRHPYWAARLATRHRDSAVAREEYAEAIKRRQHIQNQQVAISKSTNLADLQRFREDVRAVSCPQTYYYEKALDDMITAVKAKKPRTGLLTPDMHKDMSIVLDARVERASMQVGKLMASVDQATDQVMQEHESLLIRKRAVRETHQLRKRIQQIQPENLFNMPLQSLRKLRNELKKAEGTYCAELFDIVQTALEQRCWMTKKPAAAGKLNPEEEALMA